MTDTEKGDDDSWASEEVSEGAIDTKYKHGQASSDEGEDQAT